MKKDELVHLHSLLAVLRMEYERRGVASPSRFSGYDALDVSPIAVYGSKGEHARAVQALAGALARVSEDAVRESAGGSTGESGDRNAAVTSP